MEKRKSARFLIHEKTLVSAIESHKRRVIGRVVDLSETGAAFMANDHASHQFHKGEDVSVEMLDGTVLRKRKALVAHVNHRRVGLLFNTPISVPLLNRLAGSQTGALVVQNGLAKVIGYLNPKVVQEIIRLKTSGVCSVDFSEVTEMRHTNHYFFERILNAGMQINGCRGAVMKTANQHSICHRCKGCDMQHEPAGQPATKIHVSLGRKRG